MAKGRIEVNIDHCKGCGLCITACKFNAIELSEETETNRYGYRYLTQPNDKCTGCTLCAMMCPDQAIEVFREQKVKTPAE